MVANLFATMWHGISWAAMGYWHAFLGFNSWVFDGSTIFPFGVFTLFPLFAAVTFVWWTFLIPSILLVDGIFCILPLGAVLLVCVGGPTVIWRLPDQIIDAVIMLARRQYQPPNIGRMRQKNRPIVWMKIGDETRWLTWARWDEVYCAVPYTYVYGPVQTGAESSGYVSRTGYRSRWCPTNWS